jgi:rare lipoprotein A
VNTFSAPWNETKHSGFATKGCGSEKTKPVNIQRKGFLLKHHCDPQNRRVLRNVLMTTALAAIMASVASIQPTSAHAYHGHTHGKQPDQSTRGFAASGHFRHGVRDKLFARPNLFSKQAGHSAETGRSFNDSGIASVYSDQHTASGETMNSGDLTAAHRTLPFGTKVTVINHNNGRSAVVRINDRGPFVRGRVIDLSPAAGRALGVDGLALVSLSR